jgi:hypothetical protein
MAEGITVPAQEAKVNPEKLTLNLSEDVAIQARLQTGDIDPKQKVAQPLSKETLTKPATIQQVQEKMARASRAERTETAKGTQSAWEKAVVQRMDAYKKADAQRPADQKRVDILKRIGVNLDQPFTEKEAGDFYNKYFSIQNEKQGVTTFVDEVKKGYTKDGRIDVAKLKQDLPFLTKIAEMFGEKSAQLITAEVHGMCEVEENVQAFIDKNNAPDPKTNEKRVDTLPPDGSEYKLLDWLNNNGETKFAAEESKVHLPKWDTIEIGHVPKRDGTDQPVISTGDGKFIPLDNGETAEITKKGDKTEVQIIDKDGKAHPLDEWRNERKKRIQEAFEKADPIFGRVYGMLIDDFPELEQVSVENGTPLTHPLLRETPGYWMRPTKDNPLSVVVMEFGHPPDYARILRADRGGLKYFVDQLGIPLEFFEKNAEVFGAAIFLHEFGHADDYIRNYLNDQQKRLDPNYDPGQDNDMVRYRELRTLPVPDFYEYADIMSSPAKLEAYYRQHEARLKQRNINSASEIPDAMNREYRLLPSEAYADTFARDFLNRHWRDLGFEPTGTAPTPPEPPLSTFLNKTQETKTSQSQDTPSQTKTTEAQTTTQEKPINDAPLTDAELDFALQYIMYTDTQGPKTREQAAAYLNDEKNKHYRSYVRETQALMNEYTPRAVLEIAQTKIRQLDDMCAALGLQTQRDSQSPSWYIWHAAKSRFLADHPSEQAKMTNAKEYKPFDPLLQYKTDVSAENKAKSVAAENEMINTQLGWEVYAAGSQDPVDFLTRLASTTPDVDKLKIRSLLSTPPKNNRTLSSYQLQELGSLVARNLKKINTV